GIRLLPLRTAVDLLRQGARPRRVMADAAGHCTGMGRGVAHKLISSHLVDGEMKPGEEIDLRIDQTLTQDATGTLVMLELEALDLDRVHTELSVQYVDHNVVQADSRNP